MTEAQKYNQPKLTLLGAGPGDPDLITVKGMKAIANADVILYVVEIGEQGLKDKDIFLNVVGGLKISEPAADLAVAAALLSSLFNIPAPPDCIIFGEIGLSAEIRTVNYSDIRLKEAFKLGFKQAIISPAKPPITTSLLEINMDIEQLSGLHMLVEIFRSSYNSAHPSS